jgi:hypothetical protein
MTFIFTSQRFAGDAVLQEIADDDDSGTKKLQKGSPDGAVRKVQQALFDLSWANRITHPEHDVIRFVDGDYGPTTTETVLLYKKRYQIHYPPDAATGQYDGYAGPRTLQHLDGHCALLDEATAALAAKGAAVQAVSGEEFHGAATAILKTRGAFVGRSSGGYAPLPSAIYYCHGRGAFLVRAPFWEPYTQSQLMTPDNGAGPLGFPIADDREDGAGFVRQDFEWGSLRYDTAAGQMQTIVQDNVEPAFGISF